MFLSISLDDRELLSMNVSREEIHKAIFSMAPLNALGIDGFHAKFYQSQWDTVDDSVCDLI